MNEEELEKEAEELIQRFEMANSMNCYMSLTPDRKQIGEMLVMIAEPREKRIAELEKELEQAKKVQVVEHFEAYGQCRDSRKIAGLEQENAELKAHIEKMKCCHNCRKFHNLSYDCTCAEVCNEWEIKEND